ncbi:Glycoside hydrolase family 2 sugar binding [Verrucomicrobia bacterium]|nr:Glycoside hydrolase family 2 sugar binding [Verrucomicrobiota bacterium]
MRPAFYLVLMGVEFAAFAGQATTEWVPGRAPLMTRWAAEVNPTNCHPEYPRPQLVRAEWENLNGLWDVAVTPLGAAAPANYEGKILVPFPIESALSGVMRPFGAESRLWYRRRARIPEQWKGRRIRLQFGAVDWECQVFVNGHKAGEHRGGYERFAFDITDYVRWNGEEELVVAVTDPTEGDQPRGKQSRKPEGIFYTSNSGIWQTVWLEPVPEVCIDGLWMTPDLDGGGLRLRVAVNSLADNLRVEATALEGSTAAGSVGGTVNTELFLPVKSPKPWSPANPFLYDLQIILRRGDQEVDRVGSYFGLRQTGISKDEKGYGQIALNGERLFEIGTLDQGFWPEGIYTAPTDEALRFDLEFLKSAGFNLVRKHVKIEPERWYYWCDKLGLLVWQDMPSGNNATAEGQREFESELLHMIKDLYNHPAIVVWVLFNEGWGQYDTQRLTQRLKALDASRLVDNASGWADARVGDILDQHTYPGPSAPQPEPGRATVLGEFGGLGMIVPGHSWSTNRHWGYRMEPDAGALADAYGMLLREAWNLHNLWGLSAAVYTQTTDVETECNGLLSYDRAVAKMNADFLARANTSVSQSGGTRVIVPDAISGSPLWKYTFQAPPGEWYGPSYEDANWRESAAGFGTVQTPGALVRTIWDTDDIWLRRRFILGQENLDDLKLEIHHDEDAEIYFNGVLAAKLPRYIDHYERFDIFPAAIAALKPGTNTLAVHCHQTTGGQYIDVGLVIPDGKPPAAGGVP